MTPSLYEDRRLVIIALIRRYDVLSSADISKYGDLHHNSTNDTIDRMIKDHDLVRSRYKNMVLFSLPNTPSEIVAQLWEERYKSGNESRLATFP